MPDIRSRQLARLNFTLLGPVTPEQVHFQFLGPFAGREVCWDTHFLSLSRYHALQTPSAAPAARRPFIEIGAPTGDTYPLTVVLDIPHIDEAAMRRVIVMIRQYKRLATGRLEFGVARVFAPRRPGAQ